MSLKQASTSSRCLVCCPDSCLLFPLRFSQVQPSSSTAWYTQQLFHHGRRQQIQRGKLSARTMTATSCWWCSSADRTFVPGAIAQPTTWSIFRVAAMLLPPPVHKTKQCYDRHHGPARVSPFAADAMACFDRRAISLAISSGGHKLLLQKNCRSLDDEVSRALGEAIMLFDANSIDVENFLVPGRFRLGHEVMSSKYIV
jgi:hypothetical protein